MLDVENEAGAHPIFKDVLKQMPTDSEGAVIQADSLVDRAKRYYMDERYVEAEALLERALAVFSRVLGADDVKVVKCTARLGCTYVRQERYQEAEAVLRDTFATTAEARGEEHRDVAYFAHCLGWLYDRWGRLSEAQTNLELALTIQAKSSEKDPRVVISLAGIYARQRQYDRAERFYKEAAVLWAKEDPDHPAIKYAQAQLSACRWSQRALSKPRKSAVRGGESP